MESWREHMPKGMMLKSDGFASNLYDPDGAFTLQRFCAECGIAYHDSDIPVSLDTFVKYGLAFRERLVPNLEEKNVVRVVRSPDGFLLRLETGEEVRTDRVVLAVGITHFKHIPEIFAKLDTQYTSHTYQHHNLEVFRGSDVVVIGGGASAIELAGLLYEAGAKPQLVSRREQLHFHSAPTPGKPRPLWQRIRHPKSGLGPGVRSRFFANWAWAFRCLPEQLRLKLVRTALGPSAGWTSKRQVVGRVSMLLGVTPERAEVVDGKVRLELRGADGRSEVFADHIITGTGYKVDIERLRFLSADIRRDLTTVQSTPVLSRDFESSVAGLYFVGLAATNTFGPVLRFAFGAGFAARRVADTLARSVAQRHAGAVVAKAPSTTRTEETTSS
jgi:cation diffusion facilitator CzcD-associated flavoprotein CzcO